jgi:hypothetical protein
VLVEGHQRAEGELEIGDWKLIKDLIADVIYHRLKIENGIKVFSKQHSKCDFVR